MLLPWLLTIARSTLLSSEDNMANAYEGNLLIASLVQEDWTLFEPHLKLVELRQGQILFDQGEDVVATYFPNIGSIVSLVLPMRDSSTIEVVMIGYEGAVGGVVSAGNKPASARMQVLFGGQAWCIPTAVLEELKSKSKNLHNIFSRYADLLLAQTMQSVACNARHTLEERCCRWLLSTQDRVRSGALTVTQEFLAELLGVQRTTVSATAQALQSRHLIEYSRGRITITDRPGLEAAACECYTDVDRHMGAILPDVIAARTRLSPPTA
jgi:CRP-like cAMP-binding protein